MDDDEKVIDFTVVKNIKDFVATANERIYELENALYEILEMDHLEMAKEVAAEVLGEDLEVYLEAENIKELDFENETYVDDWLPGDEN